MLANYFETYLLIEKMIQTMSRAFRSRRIHIGMDEAHGIGEGRYRQIFNNTRKEPHEIFVEHLKKVAAICEKHGLQPLIWSDSNNTF